MQYLSKSDFKVARSCPTKLFYKKAKYPSLNDGNAFLAMLADGGFVIGEMARLREAGGILIETLAPEDAVGETARLISCHEITLFEPAFFHDGLLARVDVLRKKGNSVDLVEVKSKSGEGTAYEEGALFRGKRGDINPKWRPYLEDIAFQKLVLSRAHPEFNISCFLLIPDKERTIKRDGWLRDFTLTKSKRSSEVLFTGDASMLGEEDFLVELRVDAEVDELLSEVEAAADELKTHVLGKLRKPPSNIGYKCKGCEYRVDGQQSGFNECWGQLARKNPHIFSLYRVDAIKDGPNRLVDVLIQQGRAGLFDIPAESCTTAYGTRQLIQLEHMRSGTPWMDPELPRMMKAFPRPLHFIDFEAARLAVPYHAHMRPFELIPFQWSCHTLDADDRLTHREFINLEPKLPSLDFATSLRAAIPDGTVLIWSPYERTCLREVAIQIESYHPGHSDLVCWLREVADDTNRVRDQMKMTLDYYFHPHMEGSVSIKKVLPAIWNADAELRARPEFAEYAAAGAGSPYKTLPKEEILDEADMVEEGTGAIRAYEAMLFGQGSQNPEFRDARKRLLLRYCKLDTAAMVMIWRHWEMFATRSF